MSIPSGRGSSIGGRWIFRALGSCRWRLGLGGFDLRDFGEAFLSVGVRGGIGICGLGVHSLEGLEGLGGGYGVLSLWNLGFGLLDGWIQGDTETSTSEVMKVSTVAHHSTSFPW